MDGKIKILLNSAAIKSKIYELVRAVAKFSILNLRSNLKNEIVKFKKANLASKSRQIHLFSEIKLRRLAKFASKFDESALVLLRSHLLGGRYFRQSRHQHS